MMLIASLDKTSSLCYHRTSRPPHPPSPRTHPLLVWTPIIIIIITDNVPHQQEQNNPYTQSHPSLYGMARSINSITPTITAQFLLGTEPHTPTLCMMRIRTAIQTMIMPMVTPWIWMIPPSNYSSHSASKRYNSTIISKKHIISMPRRSTHKPYRNKNTQANTRQRWQRQRHTQKNIRHRTCMIPYNYRF